MSEPLPAVAVGDGPHRVVLLHGFGGAARDWQPVQVALGDIASIAFDLPGHGRALDRADLSTAEARNAVLAELDRHGIEHAHLVGHSRGGAIASLVASKAPDRVSALTLLAPGGFGEAIAADALTDFAGASTQEAIRRAMEALYAPSRPSRRAVDEETTHRQDARAVENLRTIREGMTRDGKQGVLRLDSLENAPFPVTVFWGDRDAVLPVEQAWAIGLAEVHILPGIGHMLPAKAPRQIADVVGTQFRTNRTLTVG